jgi:hypothetical protein
MRLVVARCEVTYTGRLTARLPEAVRLLMFKTDGSVLVHDDTGGFRPLNCIRTKFRPRDERLRTSPRWNEPVSARSSTRISPLRPSFTLTTSS